ncbi:ATP-dependent DNA helicase RecG [Helicobacter cappadocius]|uniref:ATP-dependent DNA helicase RecG n=1 Tax=Helicobacter cappadocius TaxID=3063998 RepID=A0AA90PS03_9HELI|nr:MULTISPECIES: ATP-dependent DNA helicase RecG [unclassified Helicobacter]MDO7252527.1 ATP-dependent DNA helicase RecG [Helicobacter sp. faydin-H75]MDP2538394.1 ATP-dependent DNA helicase RecG [Helicobacter sp. faydin-H76]
MKITSIEHQKLQKLGHKDILSFATHVPKAYINTCLLESLENNSIGVLNIEVCALDFIRGKNILKIQAFMPKFKESIEMVIFNAKSFHKNIFSVGKSLYVLGKIEYKFNKYTIVQPKPINEIGKITLSFKSTALRSSTISELAQKIITIENLMEEGVPNHIARYIETIFHPTEKFLKEYQKNASFPDPYLNALKWIEIYNYLRHLSKKRRYFDAKHICTGDYKSFIKSLPFSLTKAQNETIETIAKDLTKPIAAKRLIMGDVGCGKTIVILSAVTMAYPKKSILMAPTTILARQLYEEAQKYLPTKIKTKLITADSKDMQIDKNIFGEEVHFIIGTQALLYRDFETQDLALVMSDEQHRFGTKQRHQLEKTTEEKTSGHTKKPHVLQFSATPIPRTMAMLNSSLIDVSYIKELPFKKDITTKIIDKSDFHHLISHIQSEINQHRQIVIVYPLVEESENFDYLSLKEGMLFWKKHFKNVYVTSGKDKDKEQVLEDFRDKGDILLATTLIEVGISLPKLSSIIIVAPERLGLATLHQLRGRVSRNGLKGYCFLYTNTKQSQRLKDFSRHLSGFDIAELDLKYRNSGDLLMGERQSGAEFEFFNMSTDEAILQEVKSQIDAT